MRAGRHEVEVNRGGPAVAVEGVSQRTAPGEPVARRPIPQRMDSRAGGVEVEVTAAGPAAGARSRLDGLKGARGGRGRLGVTPPRPRTLSLPAMVVSSPL